jgi:hypothetical protein
MVHVEWRADGVPPASTGSGADVAGVVPGALTVSPPIWDSERAKKASRHLRSAYTESVRICAPFAPHERVLRGAEFSALR